MRKLQYLFMALSAMLMATPAFAQAAGGSSPAAQWVPLAAGLGMALAAGLCGLGQGKATASATEALARNPGARGGLDARGRGLVVVDELAAYWDIRGDDTGRVVCARLDWPARGDLA